MATIFHSAALMLLAVVASPSTSAAPLTLSLQGQWLVEDNAVQRTDDRLVRSAPVYFTAKIVFDPSKAHEWYSALPDQYATEYGNPVITSSVLEYGPKNSLPDSFQNTTSLLSRVNSNTVASPTPFEYYQFASSAFANQVIDGYTNAWTQNLSFRSGNISIAKGDINFVNGMDFTAILFNTMNLGELVTTSFQSFKYSYGNGAPVTYSEGFTLFGEARIVGISEIPEPSTIALLFAGVAMLAATRFRPKVHTFPWL